MQHACGHEIRDRHEKGGYEDFGSKVNRAEEDFTRTEEAAAGQLASTGAAMNSNTAIASAAGAGSSGSGDAQPSDAPTAGAPSEF